MSTKGQILVARSRQRFVGGNVSLKRLVLSLHDQAVELHFPECVEADIKFMFPGGEGTSASLGKCIVVEKTENGRFSICVDTKEVVTGLTSVELPIWLTEQVVKALITDQRNAVVLHAGAVAWKGTAVVLPGVSGSGKSSLVAWLIDRGFDYLSDEIALLGHANNIIGFPRAAIIKSGAAEKVQSLSVFEEIPAVKYGEHLLFVPPGVRDNAEAAQSCGLLVFPQYRSDARPRLQALTGAEAAFRLVECNLNARNLPDGGFERLAKLARLVPAISVEYGDFAQLEDTLDSIIRLAIEKRFQGAELRHFIASFSIPSSLTVVQATEKTYPIPPATTRRKDATPKLTVGMATYDDYDGVYFSLQAVRLYHPEIADQAEFLVIDNHPDGACAEALKKLEGAVPNYRYVPHNSRRGTVAKESVFEEAAAEFVLCMDSHVFVVPGALKRLLDYFEAHGHGMADLVQGPLVDDDLTTISTHFDPNWRGGMYGTWACDERGKDPNGPPFEIPMQGMGLFACRRATWPGFNPKFRGFGGEEGYIHEKFRQRGGRTLCLPFLRWMHRFNRPLGVPYPNTWEDRVRNYVIGFRELGLGTCQIEDHFTTLLGAEPAKSIFTSIHQELGN